MSEHAIRLRAAWEAWFPGQGVGEARRVDLPAPWPPGPEAPFRLTRAFHPPRVDASGGSLTLLLRDVPGLVAVRLDRETLLWSGEPRGPEPLEILLPGPLPGRCTLDLQVDPRGWPPTELPAGTSWGDIRLIIREHGDRR